MSTFFNPLALLSLQRDSCFIIGVELFHKKVWHIIIPSSFTAYFGAAVINDWKTIFEMAIKIGIAIFPSSVR